jgi:hypothetical protein
MSFPRDRRRRKRVLFLGSSDMSIFGVDGCTMRSVMEDGRWGACNDMRCV